MSIYEKGRKQLLLRKREEERASRAVKKTPEYRKFIKLSNTMNQILGLNTKT
jgi:hypothetical protein